MFDVKDKRMLPYKAILFGALGLYLYKLNRVNKELGGTRVSIDTDKLARAAMPYVPVPDHAAPAVEEGLKRGLNVLFERIKK